MRALKLYPIDQVENFEFMVSTEADMMNLQEVEGFNNVNIEQAKESLRVIPMADGSGEPKIRVEEMSDFPPRFGSMGSGQVLVEIPADSLQQTQATVVPTVFAKYAPIAVLGLGVAALIFLAGKE